MGIFTGKSAFVTGAASGIGNAIATRLAAEGASVLVADINAEGAEEAAKKIAEASGSRTLGLGVDVSDEDAVSDAIARTVAEFGSLDFAVNNAGLATPPTPLHQMSVSDFDHVIAVDLRGVFLTMRAEITEMLKSGGGVIVNMSSGAGLKNAGSMANYTAAKHGVVGLTKNAALEYARNNIRVNAIAPGTIATPGMAAASLEQQAEWSQLIPVGRMGTPEEVADATIWLLSDQSSFVTGSIISVDGGYLYD
ncbi:MAG: SDR family NAD(P)-dependent oxidoreductase [Rhodoglobus sp.]|nr:SDR family NAD(P)-dependent oxidoreductase [Rhodoglobus sp.]